jgi:hypothetical protein
MMLFRALPIIPLSVLLYCAPSIKVFYPGNYFPEDRTYQNKTLGFSLTYRGNWEVITDPNEMKDNKSFAKELHEGGAELLFIGFTFEKTQGTRCIASNLNETNMEYAEEIRRINSDQTDSDSGYTDDTIQGVPMVTWRYAKDEFRFIEYFFIIDTYNIRMAFWSKPRIFAKFLPVYEEIMGTLSIPGR